MENSAAVQFLESLLGRTLRIHTTDTRMFVGTFKCTDADRNIILAGTCEYRFPSPSAVQAAAAAAASKEDETQVTKADTIKVDMTSRLIGLVVVPGRYITRIEVEENPEETFVRTGGVELLRPEQGLAT
ncbi:hypothetical protein DTO164E3_42 [Paecilomyces variotii]|nr:hypothetical protein DTO032I3_3090 [Paecilomyces variotii]KAJ9207756.1 hypothetical protein DTO164E3_42 [Paecilomyces variotii]KAJ9268680.1 hypothetical protein DTO212C5_5287 [Paecilomyces variotii]KAJ9280684.1 hypothetical protein DTO021D3_2534 [Paecilomyces variotii]KAJ9327733.1 hypothetical protein DTO027B3_1441 [Paecilomyces variotii]